MQFRCTDLPLLLRLTLASLVQTVSAVSAMYFCYCCNFRSGWFRERANRRVISLGLLLSQHCFRPVSPSTDVACHGLVLANKTGVDKVWATFFFTLVEYYFIVRLPFFEHILLHNFTATIVGEIIIIIIIILRLKMNKSISTQLLQDNSLHTTFKLSICYEWR